MSDWGIKIGALVLAFLLWFYVATEHFYEKEIDIRLQVEDPPAAGPQAREVVVANPLPPYVRVLVSGRGRELLQLDEENFLLRLRPEGQPGGAHLYRLTPALVENRTSDLQVQVEEIVEPKEVEVVLDWRAEREVPVEAVVELDVADAYVQVGELRVDPGKVRISGPSESIAKIDRVRTDSLVLRGVREDVDLLVALHQEPNLRFEVSPTHVRLSAEIQILAEDDFAQVPVKVRYAGRHRVEVEPPEVQVKVRGGVDIIANLNPETDLQLYVDYRDYAGESLPVLSEENPLFEIIAITPPKVDLVEH